MVLGCLDAGRVSKQISAACYFGWVLGSPSRDAGISYLLSPAE